MCEEKNINNDIVVVYPGDIVTGTDILQFNIDFTAIVIDVETIENKYIYSGIDAYDAYGEPSHDYGTEIVYYMYVMYNGGNGLQGYQGYLRMNAQLLKDIKVLYSNNDKGATSVC